MMYVFVLNGIVTATGTQEEAMKAMAIHNITNGNADGEWEGEIREKTEYLAPRISVVGAVEMRGEGNTHSKLAEARVKAQRTALEAKGFDTKDTYFAEGTRVVSSGVEKFNTVRKQWEDTPRIGESAMEAAAMIEAEQRDRFVVRLGDLRSVNKQLIQTSSGHVFGTMEDNGIKTMSSTCRDKEDEGFNLMPQFKFAKSMADDEFDYLYNSRSEDPTMRDKKVMLHTRKGDDFNAERSIYALTGPRYGLANNDGGVYDTASMLRDIAEATQGSGMRGEVKYQKNSTRVNWEGSYHADKTVDLAAGDVFKIGVKGGSVDDGTGSQWAVDFYLRNLCLNLIIIDTGEKETYRQRHRGSVNTTEAFEQALKQGVAGWQKFAEAWGFARDTSYEDVFKTDSLEDIFDKISRDKRLIQNLGVSRDVIVNGLLAGYSEEPGETYADIVNAVTRLHERVPVHVLPQIEKYAGTMLQSL